MRPPRPRVPALLVAATLLSILPWASFLVAGTGSGLVLVLPLALLWLGVWAGGRLARRVAIGFLVIQGAFFLGLYGFALLRTWSGAAGLALLLLSTWGPAFVLARSRAVRAFLAAGPLGSDQRGATERDSQMATGDPGEYERH